jgi:hypothetical protein
MGVRASTRPPVWGWALAAVLGIGLMTSLFLVLLNTEATRPFEPTSASMGAHTSGPPLTSTEAVVVQIQHEKNETLLPSAIQAPASQHYDDSHLYVLPPTGSAHPATAQGILAALSLVKTDLTQCWQTYRNQHPFATSVTHVEWRLAQQADGSTRVEGVSITNLPEATSLSGCLVRIFAGQAFEAVPGGSVRLSFPVELGS